MENIIHTPCGDICGTDCQWSDVQAYKGICYATAKRWQYPKQITHWNGVYNENYGNCSYQPRAFYNEWQIPEKAFYYNEFRKDEVYTYSEDCLFLNIWTPKSNHKLPVIFYIHGGGFIGGCGHEKYFDEPVWPTKGVIGVTINYRLGPLGFCCLPELNKESGHTGNYGLYDQLTALKWIYDNISAFGGNPNNITIMGQSAGAMSVQQLVFSPLAHGLISKAVMSSGGGVDRNLFNTVPVINYYDFWKEVMKESSCTDLESFRKLEAVLLFKAWDKIKSKHKEIQLSCMPCIDDKLIPLSSVDAAKVGAQLNIPYLIGSISEDVLTPIIYNMASEWCKLQFKQNNSLGYHWFFNRQLPGDEHGAWHSSDLWYWFGTLKNCWQPMEKRDFTLSRFMVDYLCNFATTGNPNGENLPTWLAETENQNHILFLGEKTPYMGQVDIEVLKQTMLNKSSVGE